MRINYRVQHPVKVGQKLVVLLDSDMTQDVKRLRGFFFPPPAAVGLDSQFYVAGCNRVLLLSVV